MGRMQHLQTVTVVRIQTFMAICFLIRWLAVQVVLEGVVPVEVLVKEDLVAEGLF
jgi:hypothetical protein